MDTLQRTKTTIGKNIKMPGFRPGKVPFKIIKEKYFTSGLRDATDELAQKSFNDFLKESKVSLASYPKIDFKNLDNEDSDIEIIYDFEILPEINDFLPAITANFMASAISNGFFAFAIAVFIKTPSHPNSIAIAASEACPIPASIITGSLV